ncbi:Glucan endo-1 [Diplonema papillatum]|nr:Glucan endo-1 [Diplonema papillatum]KAJ9454150.1 Glucan endo-1 [Diplonema papillatum]KAJ9454151.1 Glucan endo-1 [Diplonema papillatum]
MNLFRAKSLALAVFAALVVDCEAAWQLVWSDEFSGTSIDSDKWNHEVNCNGGGNNEQQCYTSSSSNSWVSNGVLTIKAMPATGQTLPYSSARLNSKNNGDWTYGKFEARIKLPSGQGSWPAFWMLPTDNDYGIWPLSGEIDIMEAVNLKVGGERNVLGTLHYGNPWPNNKHSGTAYLLPNGANPADGYHTYAVEWEEGEIRWYIDGTHYQTQQRSTANYDSNGNPVSLKHRGWFHQVNGKPTFADSPFNKKFHLLLNFAVGGDWPSNVNDKGIDATAFTNGQFMYVDYVRVYQCNPSTSTGRGCATVASNYLSTTLLSGAAPDLTPDSVVVPPSSSPPPAPPSTPSPPGSECAQWNNQACQSDTGECYTCGARITYLIGEGQTDAAARAYVANEYPTECGGCSSSNPPPPPAATCSSQWNNQACASDTGECYTCGARIDYLKSTGQTDAQAKSYVAGEYPTECGACAGSSNPPPPPPPPPATPPPAATCSSQWNSNACANSECYTCGARIEYLITEGSSSIASRAQVASEFPSACGNCAPCGSQWNGNACATDNGECYTCGSRVEYLIGTGSTEAAALSKIASDFPSVCGQCG